MDYEKAYKDLMRDIDIAIEGQNDGETKVVLQNIKERNIESEDERIRKELIDHCIQGSKQRTIVSHKEDYKRWLAWLEKQKDKTTQTQIEREYVRTLKSLIADFLRGKETIVDGSYYQDIYNWLDGYHVEQKPDNDRYMEGYMRGIGEQKPAEWSEEDEKMKALCLSFIKEFHSIEASRATAWLKSLRPQHHWKPTEEQMEALRIAYEIGTANESWAMSVLKSLYEQLKSL